MNSEQFSTIMENLSEIKKHVKCQNKIKSIYKVLVILFLLLYNAFC